MAVQFRIPDYEQVLPFLGFLRIRNNVFCDPGLRLQISKTGFWSTMLEYFLFLIGTIIE